MEKLLIKKHPLYWEILDGFEQGQELIQSFVSTLLKFQDETRIQILFSGNLSLAEFIEKTSVIPFSDIRKLKFNVDQLRDAETFTAWTLAEMYKVCDGRLGAGGPRLTFEKFSEAIETPDEIIHALIATKYGFMYWLHSLPKDVDFIPFFSISNGTVEVLKDAREKLIDRYTVYATDSQASFHQEASKALEALSKLEEKFGCPGLIQRALSNNGTNYAFNLETLTELKP